MGLEIFWSQFAEDQLQDIFQYYKFKAGVKIARKIINEIVDKTLILDQNSQIGQIEELLVQREHEFRYLVSNNYKNHLLHQLRNK
jgi:plasmid stabilization system protein ParE